MKQACRRLVGIAHRDQIDMAVADEARILIRVFIDADRKNDEVRIVVMKLEEGREFLDAGCTLAPPEIEKHHLPPIVCEMNGCQTV